VTVRDGKDVMPSVAWDSLSPSRPGHQAAGPEDPGTIGARLVGWLTALLVGGAAWLGFSMAHGAPGLQGIGAEPRSVLVAVQGTPSDPGFTGFLAFINPDSRVLTIKPVNASWPYRAPGDPLATDAAHVPAAALAAAVARDAHVKLSGYFVIRVDALQEVLRVLARQAPSWPPTLTPEKTLAAIGWRGTANPRRALSAFKAIIAGLPELDTSQTTVERSVLAASRTNLSVYQVFMLATYIRGDALVMVPGHRGRGSRR
jgi:hypothetical protein